MVEETLVKESLSDQMIESGSELLRYLDDEDAGIVAAYWIYLPSLVSWYLNFVSPKIETEGPLKYYTKIHQYLANKHEPTPWWLINSVKFAGPNYSFVRLLMEVIGDKDLETDTVLRRVLVGDELVDLYFYRLPNS